MQRHENTKLYIDMPSKGTLVSQSLKGHVLLERKVLKTIEYLSDQNRGLGSMSPNGFPSKILSSVNCSFRS